MSSDTRAPRAAVLDVAKLEELATRSYRMVMQAMTSTPDDFADVTRTITLVRQPKLAMLLVTRTAVNNPRAPPYRVLDVVKTLAAFGHPVYVERDELPFDATDCDEIGIDLPPCYLYFEAAVSDAGYIDGRVLRCSVVRFEAEMSRRRGRGEDVGDARATGEDDVYGPHALWAPLDGPQPGVCQKTTRRRVNNFFKTTQTALTTPTESCVRDTTVTACGMCFRPARGPAAAAAPGAPYIIDVHLQCFGVGPKGERLPWRLSAVLGVDCL
jgi:hypothetical protein